MSTYVWVLGKTPDLSLAELQIIQATNITHKWGLVFFDTNTPEHIKLLGGLIKRWKVINFEQLSEAVQETKIVWVDSQELGLMLKRQLGVKRYKVLDLRKSDLEVKQKGTEILSLWSKKYAWIQWWQSIDLYSSIDFDKPWHGMHIGMMPSKLAHILVNIWASLSSADKDTPTVYDPFCGFGTTNFLANHLWYHTIWSDINITPAKQNIARRKTNPFANTERFITLFKHDVNDPFEKPFLKEVDAIVSEWRLGPVIKAEMLKHKAQTEAILKDYIPSIVQLYSSFLDNAKKKMSGVPILITIPEYLRLDHSIIADRISEAATDIGYKVTYLWEVYKRKKQQVGRRVVLFEIN